MSANKKNPIAVALSQISEAAHSLEVHGAGGYDLDSSALDVVLLRALQGMEEALTIADNYEYFDPQGLLYDYLSREGE